MEPPHFDVDTPTPWARASVRLIGRIAKVGWTAAIAEELDSPLIDDPDWLRTIVAWSQGKEATKPHNEYDLGRYRCYDCKDTGYVRGSDLGKVPAFRRCNGGKCPMWDEIRRRAAEYAKAKRRGRVELPETVAD